MAEQSAKLKIEEDLICTDLKVSDRWEAIDVLSELLFKKGYVTEQYAEKSKERERGFPTALPTKPTAVAIPHTWAEFCIEPAIAVGILDESVPWIEMGTKDRPQDVRIVLLLSITEPESQVHFLRTVIDFFVIPENIENLLASNGVKETKAILAKGLDLD